MLGATRANDSAILGPHLCSCLCHAALSFGLLFIALFLGVSLYVLTKNEVLCFIQCQFHSSNSTSASEDYTADSIAGVMMLTWGVVSLCVGSLLGLRACVSFYAHFREPAGHDSSSFRVGHTAHAVTLEGGNTLRGEFNPPTVRSGITTEIPSYQH